MHNVLLEYGVSIYAFCILDDRAAMVLDQELVNLLNSGVL